MGLILSTATGAPPTSCGRQAVRGDGKYTGLVGTSVFIQSQRCAFIAGPFGSHCEILSIKSEYMNNIKLMWNYIRRQNTTAKKTENFTSLGCNNNVKLG